MKTFSEYINEALLDDLSKLEKALPKEFNMREFLDLEKSLGMGYGGSYGRTIFNLAKRYNCIDKVVISKSGYVALNVWGDENGYGTYGTPKKEYQEAYEEMIDGSDEDIISLINNNITWAENQNKKEKKLVSLANILTKAIGGKVPTAKLIVKSSSINGITDGMLISFKWFKKRMEKLWGNEAEINKLSYRSYKGKGDTNTKLYDWIQKL